MACVSKNTDKEYGDLLNLTNTLLDLEYEAEKIENIIKYYGSSDLEFTKFSYELLRESNISDDIFKILFKASSVKNAENGFYTATELLKRKKDLKPYINIIRYIATDFNQGLVDNTVEFFLQENVDLIDNEELLKIMSQHNVTLSCPNPIDRRSDDISIFELIKLLVNEKLDLKKHRFILKKLMVDYTPNALKNIYYHYMFYLEKGCKSWDKVLDIIDNSRYLNINYIEKDNENHRSLWAFYNVACDGNVNDTRYNKVIENIYKNMGDVRFLYEIAELIDNVTIFKNEGFLNFTLPLLENYTSNVHSILEDPISINSKNRKKAHEYLELLLQNLRVDIANHYGFKLPITSMSELIQISSGSKRSEKLEGVKAILETYDSTRSIKEIKINIPKKASDLQKYKKGNNGTPDETR